MRAIYALIPNVAKSEATTLIQGETGTGKELVARAIHGASARAEGPFVVFDCAGVAPGLVESDLFGHVRGAFTGAKSKSGRALRRSQRRDDLHRRNHRSAALAATAIVARARSA